MPLAKDTGEVPAEQPLVRFVDSKLARVRGRVERRNSLNCVLMQVKDLSFR